ncbi:trypsin-like peptidase domain-containing protein [Luteolibacter pohnpeiensis]|uniref:Trypsin-like peptidase domain-containing protein n=1 Tax=Luteolibacter pohnpeiensis TaxID=454153 RepID=A0A934SD57_9BACT|nr:serine protease [Luteolibacter pohnpeiensis]MBK1883068.1 trypsin-like peptidase domain-containing protein [Luteolibacter pohnpeiensis]
MKQFPIRLFLCLALISSTGCQDKSDRDKIESLEREVRSLKLQLGKSAEQRAEELAKARLRRDDLESQSSWKIADLERALKKANAQLEALHGHSVEVEPDAAETSQASIGSDNRPAPEASPAFGSRSTPLNNPAPTPKTGEADASAVDAVVVIKGDQSQGTGCIIRDGQKYYLYTAAHVLAGNTHLSVVNTKGRKFTKFGDLQAAEGIDLVRLQVFEDDPGPFLEIVGPENQISVGTPISVLGNGGGAGVVAAEYGKILGLNNDTVEVSAKMIQGDSGGPVVVNKTRRVVGLASYLTAKRDDIWSQGTRFGKVRRFACRLDRTWKWTEIPLSTFLAQAQEVAEYDRMTRVAFAIGTLNPTSAGLRFDTQLSENQTALSILTDAQEMPIVTKILEMNTDLASRRIRSSDADLRKNFRSMLSSAISDVNRQGANFDPSRMSWFLRNAGQDSLQWREKAIQILRSHYEGLAN